MKAGSCKRLPAFFYPRMRQPDMKPVFSQPQHLTCWAFMETGSRTSAWYPQSLQYIRRMQVSCLKIRGIILQSFFCWLACIDAQSFPNGEHFTKALFRIFSIRGMIFEIIFFINDANDISDGLVSRFLHRCTARHREHHEQQECWHLPALQ